jgi:hypothetical protein
MLLWIIDNLSIGEDDLLVMVYNPDFIPEPYWPEITQAVPHVRFVQLAGPTRGAAETVLFGLQGLSDEERMKPTMLCDGT